MQCLPNPEEVRLALEVYKLYLEIQTLELQKDEAEQDTQRVHRNVSHEGEENVPCCLKSNMDHLS